MRGVGDFFIHLCDYMRVKGEN